MNPNRFTPPPTSSAAKPTPFQRLIARLIQRIEADNEPKHPGVLMNYEARGIDDGEYGDVRRDERPDFVKADDEAFFKS